MTRVVMDTSSLISMGLINALNITVKNIKISMPAAVRAELEEISSHEDKNGGAAKNAIALANKGIDLVSVRDLKKVEGLLSKHVNRGEAECFACCIENKIKILVMDYMDAAYRLEGPAIANGIRIRTSVAALVQLHRQNAISKNELAKYMRELIKIREWEGGALGVLADKYLDQL